MVATLDGGSGTEFTFLGDGRFGGSTGCNRFFGQFSEGADGDLTSGPVGMTMMMCPDDRMAQEHLVLTAIEAVRAISEAGGALSFLDASGAIVMELGSPESPVPGS